MGADTDERTVQFVVTGDSYGRDIPNLPVVVWVYWPPEKRIAYTAPCECPVVFKVEDQSRVEAQNRTGVGSEENAYVCQCMGEVIE